MVVQFKVAFYIFVYVIDAANSLPILGRSSMGPCAVIYLPTRAHLGFNLFTPNSVAFKASNEMLPLGEFLIEANPQRMFCVGETSRSCFDILFDRVIESLLAASSKLSVYG